MMFCATVSGLSYEAEANNVSSEEIISQILNKVEVP